MIYPSSTLTLDQLQGYNVLNSSSILFVPVNILPLTGISLAMAQISPTQDYSIRFWMSQLQGGAFTPTNASFWHLNRTVDQLLVFYDVNGTPPSDGNILAIPLPIGGYVLNFLNLVNAENIFSFSSNVIAC